MRVWACVLLLVCAGTGSTLQAQSYSAFGFKPVPDLVVPAFSDEVLTDLFITNDHDHLVI